MNDLLFLGTGAADWKIEHKGAGFRRNSAALLNRNLLIDCGKHIFDFASDFYDGTLYDRVTDILVTHGHGDHFCKESVLKIAEKQKIRLGCDAHIQKEVGENDNIEFVVFSPYAPKAVGNYEVIPLLANHDVVLQGDRKAYHYIIKTPDGKTVFYGLDGAWFLRPSWQEMLKHRYDVMVFDCTVGDREDWRIFEHNTIPMLRIMLGEIKRKNLLQEGGRLVASHLARTLHDSCEKTEQILSDMGMTMAYDGMTITF